MYVFYGFRRTDGKKFPQRKRSEGELFRKSYNSIMIRRDDAYAAVREYFHDKAQGFIDRLESKFPYEDFSDQLPAMSALEVICRRNDN